MSALKKGSELILKIESLAFGGKGVARVNDFVVFVANTLPKDIVLAKISHKKNSYAEAKCLQTLEESPLRIKPRCEYLPYCGGCQWQSLNYSSQLHYKRQQVVDSLERIGGFREINIAETIASEMLYSYRNKMEFSFSDRRWLLPNESCLDEKSTNFALGLHGPNQYAKVVDIDRCYLQSELSNAILREVKEFAQRSGFPPYSNKTHSGFWRFLVIREGKNTGEIMVNLVTSWENPQLMESLAITLIAKYPQIKSIVNNINSSRASVAFGEKERIIYGSDTILEKIGDFTFEISANSFFQTNTKQAERLYQKILEFADLKGDEIVYDLYCGIGTIAIFISKYVRKVVGIEIIEDAVRNAHRNCIRNGVKNCHFVLGDVKEELSNIEKLVIKFGRPHTVIVDPPRGGMHPKSVKELIKLAPNRIIYVSCNPTTMARDLKEFCEQRYKLQLVQPVDMFPHTAHIESITLLKTRLS